MNRRTGIFIEIVMVVSLIIVLAVSVYASEISNEVMTIADTDGNGTLTSADAAHVLQKVLNDDYQMPAERADILVGDVDENGTLTATDAAVILQKVLNNDYLMPIEKVEEPPYEDKVRIKVTVGDTVGYITDLQNNSTTDAFLEMLPYSTRLYDLDGREYWFSHDLPYDEESVQHTYAIGEFTYWCGGWITGYYDVNEDTVIEDGSVVIGTMDNTLVQTFRNAAGKPVTVSFEIDADEQTDITYEVNTQELYAQRGGNSIYGVGYIPQNINKKMPAVIFSHGYGGSYRTGSQYAQAIAEKGYFVYTFDFCGGGGNRSDGSTLNMSVFTEQEDLEAVTTMVSNLNYVDSNNIFLMGSSQGGFVSAITAEANKDIIRGEILLYPAFMIPDDARSIFSSVEEIPDTYNYLWMTVGRTYFENLLDYNVYENIGGFDKDVLIIHGDADDIVPLSYSEQAVNEYYSATLEVISGAGHGFSGQEFEQAVQWTLEYLSSLTV